MYLAHSKPELGIKNPYELDDKQYKAALELLREQRKIVSRYWHDAFVPDRRLHQRGRGGVVLVGLQVNLLKGKNRPIASVVPQEGATGWADTTMMHAQASNPNCSYMWLEHSINPKLQGDLAAWFGSVPPCPPRARATSCSRTRGARRNGFKEFDRVSFWRTPVANCGGGRTCVPYYKWVTDYIAVLGGR